MITLLTPLRFVAWLCPERTALVADGERLTYRQLYRQARALSGLLSERYSLQRNQTVGILCRSHLLSVLLLPALSRLGVHVHLLNTDVPAQQMSAMLDGRISLLIYDAEVRDHCLPDALPCPAVTAEALSEELRKYIQQDVRIHLHWVWRGGRLTVYTGGTSGRYKEASRRTGILPFLPPFVALLRQLKLWRYHSVLIALPLYHGFGLSTLIVAMLLGKKVCLLRRFQTSQVLAMLQAEEIEVLPLVPAMLARLWQEPEAARQMQTLRCIISGGDRLDPQLVYQTHSQLGPIVYNLYGTSEAGFLMLARPSELQCPSSSSMASCLGRPIGGVQCQIRQLDLQGVGTLWVRSGWAMIGFSHRWQCTSDRVSLASDGLYYHHGRADRVVVCGGENVSLDAVEQVLDAHPSVVCSCAYVVGDSRFGQVVHAQVELSEAATDKVHAGLTQWLADRLPRAARPHQLHFGPVELLSTGKFSPQEGTSRCHDL